MGRENSGTERRPLEEPAEGARSQDQYDNAGTVTPLQQPDEGAPEDANAPAAADTEGD